MRTQGLSQAVLMEESESRIEIAAREGSAQHALIARRMLEDTRLYRHWASEHARLMRSVAQESGMQRQVRALRTASFGLIHRKATFEYLRQHQITGRDRHSVFELVHGGQDYAHAVVAEHNNYVRSASSFICSNHLGFNVMKDGAFGDPMRRYEARYADYFRTFCGAALTSSRYNNGDTLSTLVPYLKRQLGNLRRAILALPAEPEINGLHKLEIREPAANSQRMATPFRAA